MNGAWAFAIGAAAGFFMATVVPAMILAEIAIRRGTTRQLQRWIDEAPKIGGVSVIGWFQVLMAAFGGVIGTAVWVLSR